MTKDRMNSGSGKLLEEFREFLAASPTPYHAVQNLVKLFAPAGFEACSEAGDSKSWPPRGYSVRGDSSIIVWNVDPKSASKKGLRLVGAHTDSPCLKVKPQPEVALWGIEKLAVEVYGSPLLSTWFDRDLSMAGRVTGLTKDGELVSRLIDFKKPMFVIPNLAIHLNRNVNRERSINDQLELPALWRTADAPKPFRESLLQGKVQLHRVLDFDLSLYDTVAPSLVGASEQWISSARLDNLLSTFCGAKALLEADSSQSAVFMAFDHEEVGSTSYTGADGSFARDTLRRVLGSDSELSTVFSRSVLASVDNAHAIHPNYPDRMEPSHAPRINGGVVLKYNSGQRYATTDRTAAIFALACESAKAPYQRFVVRSDMQCGSTIGPLVASALGVATVDVGCPQWAMHSIRETAGCDDILSMHRALVAFLSGVGTDR